jgi:hypothetical protein
MTGPIAAHFNGRGFAAQKVIFPTSALAAVRTWKSVTYAEKIIFGWRDSGPVSPENLAAFRGVC